MRAALHRTWYPFFARFSQPTAVQIAAWRPLLEGADCLVCSPTASGKTEAVLAPLVERHLERGGAKLPRIVVVCPTRALVNDYLRRVRVPLERLALRAHRRTGDHAALDRLRPPDVLITTPESLDSLLSRHTGFLRGLRAAVLDELHILDGTPRGDQLRILLARLRRLLATRDTLLQAVASSATMHTPAELAARYLERAEPVVVEEHRDIVTEWVACPGPAGVVAALTQRYGDGGARKILVFVDRRADVETLAAGCAASGRLGARVYAHHGSLSRTERERVEERFLRDPSAICFATPTLELGIDVGDVDLVALIGPPASVSSFLQRLGRGNRRNDRARVLGCYRDVGELARFRHLAALARAGDLCPEPYVFRPSVLVQQVGSLLLQSRQGWVSTRVLHERLPPALRDGYPPERLGELFAGLRELGWLLPGRLGRQHAGEPLVEAFQRGSIHSNIANAASGVEVIDETTGQQLGSVVKTGAERMAIAGRSRRVLREEEGRLYVATESGAAADALFASRGRPTMTRPLARAFARFLEIPERTLPWVEAAEGFALFHFAGSLGGAVLAQHLRKQHEWPIARETPLCFVLRVPPGDTRPPAVDAPALAAAARRIARRLASLAAAGPHHARLPRPWRRAFLAETIPFAAVAATWTAGTIEHAGADELAVTLAALAAPRPGLSRSPDGRPT